MNLLREVSHWLTGGDTQYMTLLHCMSHDYITIAVTVLLDLSIAAGYVLIAIHWWRNQRSMPLTPARNALGDMRSIFLFCGICGYLFIPIKMVWPAWRLYDFFLAILSYFTWRYALSTRKLKVVYSELGRSQQLAVDLEQSRQETQRKTFFLNAISHDLRTPLNGMLLHANLAELSLSTGDSAQAQSSMQDIQAAARQAAAMLNSLLEYARLDLGEDDNVLSEFSLLDLVQIAIRTHAPAAAQKGLSISTRIPAEPTLHCDRLKLERVLGNLLHNAIKFTQTGSITIEADFGAVGVEIHVVDTGVGIHPEARQQLFDEFFQVHNRQRDQHNGFGLGLAISRRLARQLGGDISVESAPGQGSRFTILLPSALCRSHSAHSLATAAASAPASGPTGLPAGSSPEAGS